MTPGKALTSLRSSLHVLNVLFRDFLDCNFVGIGPERAGPNLPLYFNTEGVRLFRRWKLLPLSSAVVVGVVECQPAGDWGRLIARGSKGADACRTIGLVGRCRAASFCITSPRLADASYSVSMAGAAPDKCSRFHECKAKGQ